MTGKDDNGNVYHGGILVFHTAHSAQVTHGDFPGATFERCVLLRSSNFTSSSSVDTSLASLLSCHCSQDMRETQVPDVSCLRTGSCMLEGIFSGSYLDSNSHQI